MKRILLIEDEAIQRLLYRQEFEFQGYEVLEACCCKTAQAQLADQKIDLVILDILLPNGSCFDLLEQIVIRRRDLPVIINTGYDTFRFDFKSWAADAFVTKSSDLTELKDTVAQLLDRNGAFTNGERAGRGRDERDSHDRSH